MRIAVDIGGTFTDLVAVDDQGRIYRSKSLTTPDDLARGIDDCLKGANIDVAGASFFVHVSTITINAVLEHIGALKAAGVESVAVCLLHAYANAEHERRLGELLHKHFAEAYASLSHEILREFREYERTS